MNELPFCVVLEDGEVLFSMMARSTARYGAIGQESVVRRLTGQRRLRPLLSAIPGFVSRIAERVPYGNPLAYSTSTIQKHTSVPYFTFFLGRERAQTVIGELASGSNAHDVFMSIGLAMYRSGSAPIHPRWCVECNRLSELERGFAFYRTEHQLPGIATCWIHGEVLCHGCDQCGPNPVRNWGLDLPGRCRCGKTVRPLPVLKDLPGTIEVHNWLARKSAYLLTGAVTTGGISVHRLRTLFGNHGFLSGTQVNTEAVAAALARRFGSEFLKWLGYPERTGDRPSSWVRDFLVPSRSERIRAAIQYLLFAGVVADSVHSFLEEISRTNGAASELTTLDPPAKAETPMSLGDVLRRNDWRISKTAAALGCSPYWVASEALKQNLAVPLSPRMLALIGESNLARAKRDLTTGVSRAQIRSTYGLSEWALQLVELDEPSIRETRAISERTARRDFHRTELNEAISQGAVRNRQALRQAKPATYEFMVANDREWLAEHLPRTKPERRGKPRKVQRGRISDDALSKEVERSALELKEASGRPQRISKTRLLRLSGALSSYYDNMDRFPLTSAILARVSETKTESLKRRIGWAIKQEVGIGLLVSVDRLRRTASVAPGQIRNEQQFVRECAEGMGCTVHPNLSFSK